VKEFWKSVNFLVKWWARVKCLVFLTHSVYTIITSSVALIKVHRMDVYRKSRDLLKFLEISANTLEALQDIVAWWSARLTAVWKEIQARITPRTVVFIATAAAHFTALPRLTQPCILHGTVKWVSTYGLSNNNSGDGGLDGSCQFSADSHPKSTGLVRGCWPPGTQSIFIKWTGWTLSLILVMMIAS